MKTGEPIIVWRFYDAPKELRFPDNGGDEDWLAEVPPALVDSYIGWMESGSEFGCCCVDEYDHPTKSGWKVRIGSHA